jgi:MscS family membrane protein
MKRRANALKWGVTAWAILLVVSVPAAQSLASGDDAVNVLSIDEYAKGVSSGGSTTYNWTLQNLYSAVDLTVVVNASVTGSGWTCEVASDRVVLPSNGLGSVVVTVNAPATTKDSSSNLSVSLNVYDRGFLVQRTTLYADTFTKGAPQTHDKVLNLFKNPLPSPLDTDWGVFLLDVALWIVIVILVTLGVVPLLRRLSKKSKIHVAEVAIRIIRTPLVILVILYGAIQSMVVIEEHVPSGLRSMLFRVYGIVLAIVGLYVAYKLFKEVVVQVAKNVAKRTQTHLDDMMIPIVEKIGLVVIGLAGLGLLLGFLQVDLTLFVAGGVVTSMVIAFAAQDTLSNFFSGIFILTDQPFKEGDIVIMSDGDWAQVRRIGMRTTRLFRFSDASIITLPNNKLVNEKIANFTNPQDPGRLMKTFNVAYGSDVLKVKKIINDVIEANPHIVKEDPLKPIVRFDAMSDSSLDFFVLIWLDSRDSRFTVTDYLNTEIYTRFNEAGIDIPFPQRTVHLRMDNQPDSEVKTPPIDLERIAGDSGNKAGTRRKSGK